MQAYCGYLCVHLDLQMEDDESVPELRAKIADYNSKLAEVDDLLQAEPGNSEYLQIRTDLVDVITLTKDLLKMKEAEEAATPAKALPFIPPSTTPNAHANFFAIGTICEAKYSADGVWYKAKINAILEGGKYHVTYTDYGNEEVVSITDIRPLPDTAKKSSTLPLKRPAVPDAIQQIPKSLQVLPTDTEEQRAAKKKKVKAIKSANRLKTMDEEGKSKKSAWEKFQNKPKKNVPMSYSGRKKESIFKSPDGGKIGVTGSGMNISFHFIFALVFSVSNCFSFSSCTLS
jgi:survival-of-motor-neuron-related-splicing factor 30